MCRNIKYLNVTKIYLILFLFIFINKFNHKLNWLVMSFELKNHNLYIFSKKNYPYVVIINISKFLKFDWKRIGKTTECSFLQAVVFQKIKLCWPFSIHGEKVFKNKNQNLQMVTSKKERKIKMTKKIWWKTKKN